MTTSATSSGMSYVSRASGAGRSCVCVAALMMMFLSPLVSSDDCPNRGCWSAAQDTCADNGVTNDGECCKEGRWVNVRDPHCQYSNFCKAGKCWQPVLNACIDNGVISDSLCCKEGEWLDERDPQCQYS
jgi:hypothetical protein